MLTTLQQIIETANGAIASFNCIDLEMARGCIEAAEAECQPVIIGVASRHWNVLGGAAFIPSLRKFCEEASVPVALHLDHAGPHEMHVFRSALDSGFSSVMMDGSKCSFEENVRVTSEAVSLAEKYGVGVEGELGPLAGIEGLANQVDASEMKKYTDPDEALQFCQHTGVSALAVAVGTAHGLYKDEPEIQQDLISLIAEKTGVALVLHGATGVPEDAIIEAVSRGVKKINYFSGLLVSAMDSIRAFQTVGDQDYLGFRMAMRQSWKDCARNLICLYRGDKPYHR